MAYMDSRTPMDRAKSIGGALAVQAAVAYALVVGLQLSGVIENPPRLSGETVTEVPIDPPPPPPDPKPSEQVPEQTTRVYTPPTKIDLVSDEPKIDVVDIPLPPQVDVTPKFVPETHTVPAGPATKTFDVIAPKPKNDAGRWVTTADYRSSWISREYTGVTRFRLDVGADGSVRNCTITQSSGHSELDRATCDLVSKRARFSPGQDSTGAKAGGSYSSAVSWQLPG